MPKSRKSRKKPRSVQIATLLLLKKLTQRCRNFRIKMRKLLFSRNSASKNLMLQLKKFRLTRSVLSYCRRELKNARSS